MGEELGLGVLGIFVGFVCAAIGYASAHTGIKIMRETWNQRKEDGTYKRITGIIVVILSLDTIVFGGFALLGGGIFIALYAAHFLVLVLIYS